jgi:hypothetical protein
MTEFDVAQRGQEAAQVLDNEAFKEAMGLLKSQVVEQWRNCPVRDKEGQILLLQLAKVADKFEGTLVGMIERGKMAQHKIDLDSMRDEGKARRFFRKVVG